MRVRPTLLTKMVLATAFLMLRAPARAEETGKAIEPPLLVQLTAASFRGLDRVEVSVRGQTKETWRCVLHDGRRRAIKESPCARTSGWMSEALGEYAVLVSSWRHGERRPVAVGQKFMALGEEIRIRTRLWFRPVEPCDSSRPAGSARKDIPTALATLTLDRVLPTPQGLTLRRAWDPRSNGALKYELDNRSQLEWFGTGNNDNFFGRVETFQAGAWTPYLRGGKCGTDGEGKALMPGSKTQSIEGYFLDDARPFAPGRYRYVVEVARERHPEYYSCALAGSGAPLLHAWDTYELSDEFSIER